MELFNWQNSPYVKEGLGRLISDYLVLKLVIIYENIQDSIFVQTWDSQDRFSKNMIVENLNLFQSDFRLGSLGSYEI